MAVYVDEIVDWGALARARGLRYSNWCHLLANTEQELHEFAAKLGLRRSWYQRKGPNDVAWHYDIVPTVRAKAIRLGAQEVNWQFVAQLMNRRRAERDRNAN